jgi:hypothetical protein
VDPVFVFHAIVAGSMFVVGLILIAHSLAQTARFQR